MRWRKYSYHAALAVLVVSGIIQLVRWVAAEAFAMPTRDPGLREVVDIGGYPGWGADTAITCGAASGVTAALAAGLYVVTCDQPTSWDQGTTGVAATTSERFIPANAPYTIKILANADDILACIRRGSTDALCVISKDTY